jgi:hypothetical protein
MSKPSSTATEKQSAIVVATPDGAPADARSWTVAESAEFESLTTSLYQSSVAEMCAHREQLERQSDFKLTFDLLPRMLSEPELASTPLRWRCMR